MCHGVPLAYGLESLHGQGYRCHELSDVRRCFAGRALRYQVCLAGRALRYQVCLAGWVCVNNNPRRGGAAKPRTSELP
jgi:hypothetical protein